MPTKSTKTTKKTDLKTSKKSEKKSSPKTVVKETSEKKDSTKKTVIKRRKVDLIPTKASAVAIASQASRAKKQALIDKVASKDIPYKRNDTPSDTKIPLRVRTFFGISLILFCISFYQAVFRPQLKNNVLDDIENIESTINRNEMQNIENNSEVINNSNNVIEKSDSNSDALQTPNTPKDVIESFFNRLSNRQFDEAFDLMIPAVRNATEIRDHFTSFRMNPFLD